MCRKNLIPAAALLGFGAGVWTGLVLEGTILLLVVGGAAICGGIWLLRCA